MAKSTTTPPVAAPKSLIPVTTDARSELYFLLGRLHGLDVGLSERITVLVTQLTQTPAPLEVQ